MKEIRRNSGKLAVLLTSVAMLIALATVPKVFGDTASGEATVGNASPQVMGLNVSTATAAPESTFTVYTEIKDTNTLDDIDNVIVEVYENTSSVGVSDSKGEHYTFWFDPSDNTWHSSPNTNDLGTNSGKANDAFINSTDNYPSDLTVSQDNYNFEVFLNGTADHANNWDVFVKAVDSASASDNSTSLGEFGVAKYQSYAVSVGSLEWTGLSVPSDNNACDNNVDNPIVDNIETNTSYDIKENVDDWSDGGGTTISANNTKFSQSTGGAQTAMSTSLKDVYSSVSEGENVSKDIYHWLYILTGTPAGTYSTSFYIEVAEAA